MGDNLEKLLMDDSSSGESDTEVAVGGGGGPPAAAAAPKKAAPMTEAELQKLRLKSMYSPASKAAPSQQQQQPPSAQQQRQMMMSQQQQQQQQQQQRPSAPPTTQQRGGVPGGARSTLDPFAPTPVSQIRISHQQLQLPPQQQPQRYGGASSSTVSTTSSVTTVPTANTSTDNRAAMEAQLKKQKERFLIFTRVLVKYLEQKDPPLHARVKAIIKDCAERNKKQEPGYESVTSSMRKRLKEAVNDAYWKRAEAYLQHFLKEKSKAGGSSSSTAATTQSTGFSSSLDASTADASKSLDARKKAMELERIRQLQQQRKAPPQQAAASSAGNRAVSLGTLRRDIAQKREALGGAPLPGAVTSVRPSASAYPSSGASAASAGSAKPVYSGLSQQPPPQQQSGKGKTAAAAAATKQARATSKATAAASPMLARKTTAASMTEAPPREYSEFMEMVDHAVDFDWTSAGLVMGQKLHAQLSEEQRNLLYSSTTTTPAVDTSRLPYEGWSGRNVISARVAWARIRLPEEKAKAANPTVAGGLLSMPAPKGTSEETTKVDTSWHNDQVAEYDMALTALSEGAEIYLKSILEKALHCARQRQNVDGIRLWHQQLISSAKPALSLRLGCDVNRQVARAEGNAALTCKRMEEALERQEEVPSRERILKEDTLMRAQSMSEVALRPKLANGVEDADMAAKRSFEVYGGKEANEPVLGRVPKKAKIEVIDFQMGMNLSTPKRGRAETVSGSFVF